MSTERKKKWDAENPYTLYKQCLSETNQYRVNKKELHHSRLTWSLLDNLQQLAVSSEPVTKTSTLRTNKTRTRERIDHKDKADAFSIAKLSRTPAQWRSQSVETRKRPTQPMDKYVRNLPLPEPKVAPKVQAPVTAEKAVSVRPESYENVATMTHQTLLVDRCIQVSTEVMCSRCDVESECPWVSVSRLQGLSYEKIEKIPLIDPQFLAAH